MYVYIYLYMYVYIYIYIYLLLSSQKQQSYFDSVVRMAYCKSKDIVQDFKSHTIA